MTVSLESQGQLQIQERFFESVFHILADFGRFRLNLKISHGQCLFPFSVYLAENQRKWF